MKLLFDENVRVRLPLSLSDEFPGSAHVRSVGLRGADDRRIWDFARSRNYTIVSKDTDFRERSFVDRAPPKVVWLDVGNVGTETIEELLRQERKRIEHFAASEESSFLILSLGQKTV